MYAGHLVAIVYDHLHAKLTNCKKILKLRMIVFVEVTNFYGPAVNGESLIIRLIDC